MQIPKIGWIGFGQMAMAMARGWLCGGIPASAMGACARNLEALRQKTESFGIRAYPDARSLAKESEILILAVKPYAVADVLRDLEGLLQGKTLVSVAAGVEMETLVDRAKEAAAIVRMIPNTPAEVGQAVYVVDARRYGDETAWRALRSLLEASGEVILQEGSAFTAMSTVTGCGPAMMALLLEALGDAALLHGLSREDAYRAAALVMRGTAELYLKTKRHPGVLKDAVTSPGGTTIRAIRAMEQSGVRHAMFAAVDAVYAAGEERRRDV